MSWKFVRKNKSRMRLKLQWFDKKSRKFNLPSPIQCSIPIFENNWLHLNIFFLPNSNWIQSFAIWLLGVIFFSFFFLQNVHRVVQKTYRFGGWSKLITTHDWVEHGCRSWHGLLSTLWVLLCHIHYRSLSFCHFWLESFFSQVARIIKHRG